MADLQRQAATANAGNSAQYVQSVDGAADRQWRTEQAALDRELRREESSSGREFESLERALDRGLTREEWEFRQNESALDRGMTREEWDVRREESARDRGWRSEEAERDRGFGREQWAWDRENMNTDARNNMFRDVLQMTMGTVLSSPDYFRDPAAASGFMSFFTGQFAELFASIMGGRNTPPPVGG